MLTKMLEAPRNSQLTGTPTRLSSLISSVTDRDQQSRIVDAYWTLSSATTDYYLGLHEADELSRLKQRLPTFSSALSEALTQHNRRVSTSLMAARAAQYRLSRLMGGVSRSLPIDTPFCGPYATRYEQIFTGGGAEEARLLRDLIPLRLSELEDAVEAVERSEQWLAKVAGDRAASSQGTGMIRALELLALNRRALVMITRDYNLQINRYTQLATPGNIASKRLVAMLIRVPTNGQSGYVASGQTFQNESSRGLEFRSGGSSNRY